MHRPRLRATRCAGYGRDFEAAMTVTCGPLLRAARACERRADPRPVGRVGRGAWRGGAWPEVVVTILLLSAGVACMGGFPISGSLAMRYLPSAWYGAGDDDATVSAWMDAATTGDARRLARMLDEHACEVDARDSSGRTALILAAQYGHEDCCRLLVSYGARLDATSSCGFAPLPSAAAFGRESTAIFLVSAGADVNQRSLNGQTPLMLAAANGEPRLLRALMDAGAAVAGAVDGEGAGALHYAA